MVDEASVGKGTFPFLKASGDFYSIPSIISWQGPVVYLDIEGDFYSLDLSTMKLEGIY